KHRCMACMYIRWTLYFRKKGKNVSLNMWKMVFQRKWGIGLLLFFCLWQWNCGDGLNVFRVEDDIQLGRQLRDEILANPAVYPVIPRQEAPFAYTFVENMRDEILQAGQLKYADVFDWEIYLLQDDSVLNAFCAPGGYIFIYTGIIKFLD